MKTKFFWIAGLSLLALAQAKAQSEPVKLELPPDQVIRHFRANNSGTAAVTWLQFEDDKDTYITGTFHVDGDAKKVIYRNNAWFCSETKIPLNYAPAKIKAALDSLAPGFELKELYYQTAVRDKGYRAVMQKGKKKKAEFRHLLFSAKNQFMKEEEAAQSQIYRF
ncbi:MAG: hypothetical protein K2O66_08210 [Bacteroidales bacterium]|nr:hypothetical protein [Bacteroidales bacterium]MDE7073329.1 hypothetical protein [Bacteroidales bacterium]